MPVQMSQSGRIGWKSSRGIPSELGMDGAVNLFQLAPLSVV